MKRFCSLILAVLMTAAVLPFSGLAAGESSYSDVSPDDWYASAVEDCTDRGLMNGTGEGQFTPDGDLTRAMLVTVLWRLNGCPAPAEDPGYSDVPSGQWYSDAIAWASGFRVVEGYGGGVFGTNDPVTREQMAVIFYRWAQGNDMDVSVPAGPEPNPHDASDWAADSVNWAADRVFLTPKPFAAPHGYTVYLIQPRLTATRAEVAVFLSRFCQAYVDEGSGRSEEPSATIPYNWDILTMDLPESWQGAFQAAKASYDGVPDGRSILFWDLSNVMPRSSHGFLFQLTLWPVGTDSSWFGSWETLGDFAYNKSGRICTVEVPGEGQLALYVDFPKAEDGPRYDPENPKNYVNMYEEIDGILRTIRFREDVTILSLAPALSASLSTKTGPLP